MRRPNSVKIFKKPILELVELRTSPPIKEFEPMITFDAASDDN